MLAIFSLLLSLFSDSNSGLYAADKIRNPETSQRQVLTYLISDTAEMKSSVDEFFLTSGGTYKFRVKAGLSKPAKFLTHILSLHFYQERF